jgi:hypothetical protein
MANVSVGVQIETKTKHELSIPFQSVAGNRSLNVGTLLISPIEYTPRAAAFCSPAACVRICQQTTGLGFDAGPE